MCNVELEHFVTTHYVCSRIKPAFITPVLCCFGKRKMRKKRVRKQQTQPVNSNASCFRWNVTPLKGRCFQVISAAATRHQLIVLPACKVGSLAINARCPIETQWGVESGPFAHVYVILAALPRVTVLAETCIFIHQIHARASIQTGSRRTVLWTETTWIRKDLKQTIAKEQNTIYDQDEFFHGRNETVVLSILFTICSDLPNNSISYLWSPAEAVLCLNQLDINEQLYLIRYLYTAYMIWVLQLTDLVGESIQLVIAKATQWLQTSPHVPPEHPAGELISTHINVCFTSDAGPSWFTETGVRIDSIEAATKAKTGN